MNIERIRAFRRLLPSSTATGDVGRAATSYAENISGYASWEDIPEVGYVFIMELLRARQDLPAVITEKWLVHLYRMERYKFYNKHVAEAISWREPARKKYRAVVEGMLISEDAPIDLIAEKTNLDAQTIECYEQLFFNVKDRMEDNLYLSTIAYPEGVSCHSEANYFTKTDPALLLLRAGFNHGYEDVLFFAGMRGHSGAGVDAAAILEQAVMTEAVVFARQGGLAQRGLPQIASARAIIIAKKSGGENERPPDPTGLSDMGAILCETMRQRAHANVQKVLDNKGDAIDVDVEEIVLQKD